MIVHGIDLKQLGQRDFDSFAEASVLLYDLALPLYVENKDAWKILTRARRYITTLHTFAVKPPRTFNRDLLYPVKKDADGNRLCRWCQKPVGKRRSYCGKPCLKEVDIRCSAGMLRHYVKERDKGICACCGCDTQKLKRVLGHAAHAFYKLRNGDSTETWYRGDFRGKKDRYSCGLALIRISVFGRLIIFWK